MSAKVAKVRCRLHISIGCTGNMMKDRSISWGFFGQEPKRDTLAIRSSGIGIILIGFYPAWQSKSLSELEHGHRNS